MILDDILNGKTVVSFRSKREAIEYVSFLRDILGGKLSDYVDGRFYQHAEFYDRCVEYYGDAVGDEPAIIVEIDTDDGEDRYTLDYCNTGCFKKTFHSVVYYGDIRHEDIFKVDSAESWGGDAMQLLM